MTATQDASPLTIGQVATRAGVAPDTVRYYERAGLLPPPCRTSGEHRRYGTASLDRLLFIRGAQRLGLRLAEIRELLAVRDSGACACGPAQAMLHAHLASVDAEISRLAGLRGELTRMLGALSGPDCPDPLPGTWCPPGNSGHEEEGG